MDQTTFMILLIAAMMGQKPAPACPAAELGKQVRLAPIKLDDPTKLPDNSIDMLKKLAAFMQANKCGISVVGSTNDAGKDQRADLTRAETVKTYLTWTLPAGQRVLLRQVTVDRTAQANVLRGGAQNTVQITPR
jgi:hypothetical protein